MKNFSLEEYLKNQSQKIVTRDGRQVRIICTDAKYGKCPIVGLVFNKEQGEEEAYNFMENGKFFPDQDWFLDLFFAPTKREGWINIYRCKNDTRTIGCLFSSKEEANFHKYDKNSVYIKTIKIEWEE